MDGIEPAELTDVHRLVERYCAWQNCPHPSEIDDPLLTFIAAAHHAATVNPTKGEPIRSRPALFRAMVEGEDYDRIREASYDAANRKLADHLHGSPQTASDQTPSPAPPASTEPPTDAEIAQTLYDQQHGDHGGKVRAVKAELRRKGLDPERREAAIEQIAGGDAEKT